MIDDGAHFHGVVTVDFVQDEPQSGLPEVYFKGYLTNRADLDRQIADQSRGARSVKDLIAECYLRWLDDLPQHLDGQFALVVVDRVRRRILLTHDALGICPLYWSLKKGVLRYSTRICDLIDDEARSDPSIEEIKRYVLLGSAVCDKTIYPAISRLEPGVSIWVANGTCLRTVTWDPRKLEPVLFSRTGDYLDRFIDLVESSVKSALLNCDSAWLALSGGLDSNTILPPAQRFCADLKAYSIVSPQWPDVDESKWIKRIVEKSGIVWQPINAEEVLPFSDFPKDFGGSPDTAFMNLRSNRVIGELVGGDVVLTGDGGDSFMGAQLDPVPSHLADPLFLGNPMKLPQNLARWAAEAKPVRPLIFWLLHGLILPSARHLLQRRVRPPDHHQHPRWLLFGGKHSGALASQAAVAPHCKTPGQQAILDELWQFAEQRTAFAKPYGNRHPLFNRALFEFLWSIPWSQKQLPLCDRYLQRRALKGLVDDDIRTRIGRGAGSRNFVEGFRRSRPWQEYLCERPLLAERGLVDAQLWRQAIQQATIGQTNAEPLLARAMAVEVWLKQLAAFSPRQHAMSRMALA